MLQDGQMTPDLQDDEVEGIYTTVMYSAGCMSACLLYLQLYACSPPLGVSPHHATAEESGINNEKSLFKKNISFK